MIIDKEAYLSHVGVKGMRWGVVNEDDAAVLKTKFEGFSKDQKYGSMNDPEPKIEEQGFFKSLTPAQKKAAVIFGGTVVVAGLAYGAHRYMGKDASSLLRNPQEFLDGKDAFDNLGGPHKLGLLAYRDKGIELPAGSLVARVSKDIETNIRPGGFYAAHEYHDVEGYKDFLGTIGGHTNFFKSTKAIKAPSTREYVKILADAMDTPEVLSARGMNIKELNKLAKPDRDNVLIKLATEELSKRDFAYSLNASTVDGVLPKRFVERVLGAGYTSVIDYNNASPATAQAPMRHLDGTMFKFFSSEEITGEVKQIAKLNLDDNMDKIADFYDSIVHSLFLVSTLLGAKVSTADEFVTSYLEHFGTKGMKWGVRKNKPQTSNLTPRQQAVRSEGNKMIKRSAAVGVIAIGAVVAASILSKQGGTKVSSLKVDPMPFKVSGKNFKIEAATGEALDTAVKAILENRRGR